MISSVSDTGFHRFKLDIVDPCERFILFGGFFFGKMWKTVVSPRGYGWIGKIPHGGICMAGLGYIRRKFHKWVFEHVVTVLNRRHCSRAECVVLGLIDTTMKAGCHHTIQHLLYSWIVRTMAGIYRIHLQSDLCKLNPRLSKYL